MLVKPCSWRTRVMSATEVNLLSMTPYCQHCGFSKTALSGGRHKTGLKDNTDLYKLLGIPMRVYLVTQTADENEYSSLTLQTAIMVLVPCCTAAQSGPIYSGKPVSPLQIL